jgi:two-component system sensor histidine kinase/response regulator
MNDHLAKPIDPEKLYDTLLRWIPPRPAGVVAAGGGSPSYLPVVWTDSLVIPGIDTASALKRAGGNQKRYESLLNLFANSQSNAVSEIRTALGAGDSATAQRVAHSLKGASANLGAASLAECAAKVESAIGSNQSTSAALEELSQSLAAAVTAIRVALPVECSTPNPAAADPATVAQPLIKLKKLLEADDGEASEFIMDARPQLSKVLTPVEVETLTGQVGNFAYADALQSISGIAARLALNLE